MKLIFFCFFRENYCFVETLFVFYLVTQVLCVVIIKPKTELIVLGCLPHTLFQITTTVSRVSEILGDSSKSNPREEMKEMKLLFNNLRKKVMVPLVFCLKASRWTLKHVEQSVIVRIEQNLTYWPTCKTKFRAILEENLLCSTIYLNTVQFLFCFCLFCFLQKIGKNVYLWSWRRHAPKDWK